MDTLDRRDVFALFSALAAVGVSAGAAKADEPVLATSKVMHYADLPLRTFPNGGEQRRVVVGNLPTGEFIEVHETVLPAGVMSHPPHKHPNSELLFIQTGTLEYIDNAGARSPIGPGDIIFTASNQMHGLANVGTSPAKYMVVSVSKQIPEA